MRQHTVTMMCLAALVGVCVAHYKRTVSYEDEVLVKCTNQGKRSKNLHDHLGSDLWSMGPDKTSVVRIKRAVFERVMASFPECAVMVNNLEAHVQRAEKQMHAAPEATWFQAYHEYADIVDWYTSLAQNYSKVVTFVSTIGKSVEGRDMPAVHITAATAANTPKIYFQCQIHAREWISGAVCMYVANYLAQSYGTNATVTSLLDSVEFVIVPFVNPDGYDYTWTKDRLWRKNRRPGTLCDGVDLNRNYNIKWGGGGSSSDPCSETYHGKSVASEPETQNTANYFKANGPIIGAIDWHSYSQLVLRPYGYTTQDCPNEAQLKALGDTMSTLIKSVHGTSFTSEKSIDLYITTGTASDWFYSDDAAQSNKGNRAAGYTIELRDTGKYGFILPASQIIPSGEEMVPAVIYFAQQLLKNPIPYP